MFRAGKNPGEGKKKKELVKELAGWLQTSRLVADKSFLSASHMLIRLTKNLEDK